MPLTDLVAPNAIIPALKVNGKKQALQELAAKAAELSGQNERTIFEILMQREKLGSTGVGNGIAIPHGKLPKLNKLFGLFARLDRPVDFEALDGQPVDLVFLLLAPEGAGADHLKALARVARLLRDSGCRPQAARLARRRSALRGAGDAVGKRGVIDAVGFQRLDARVRHSCRKRNAGHLVVHCSMRGDGDCGPRHWQRRSVHADRLELLAPGVGDRGLAAVGQHDRRAVGRVQREQLHAGRELRRLREHASARPRSGSP